VKRRLSLWWLVTGKLLLNLLAADRTPNVLRGCLVPVVMRAPALAERGLGALEAPELAEAARDARLRPLLRQPGQAEIDRDLIRHSLSTSRLQPALVRHLRVTAPEGWSTVLYETIVLDRAEGAVTVAGALAIVAPLAGSLVPQHERAIFGRCIELLSVPADPYSSASGDLTAAAREASGALLAADSSLDSTAAEAMATGSAPLLRAAVASAIKASGAEGPRRFLTYARKLSPDPEALVRFGEDCDSRRSGAEPPMREVLTGPSVGLRIRARVWPGARLMAPLCVGPALALGLGLALSAQEGRLVSVGIDSSVAVGALASSLQCTFSLSNSLPRPCQVLSLRASSRRR
jgi:hypothetical protein